MVTSAINRKNTPASKPQTSELRTSSDFYCAAMCAFQPSCQPPRHCGMPRAPRTWNMGDNDNEHEQSPSEGYTNEQHTHTRQHAHTQYTMAHTHTHTRMFCAHLSGNMIRNTTHTYEYKDALLTHDRTRHRPPKTEDLRSLCLD